MADRVGRRPATSAFAMNWDLVDLLACPGCGGDVTLAEAREARGKVQSGKLACGTCDVCYPIRGGIPRFADADARSSKTAEHFELEFTASAEGDRDVDEPELLAFIFSSRTGLAPAGADLRGDWYPTSAPAGYSADFSTLTGKLVLEGGCGAGRFLPMLAPHAVRVVGLELGPHIDRAAARCAALGNVDLVQGSVLAPPLRRRSFDITYTLGVLHHTEDPASGARALAECVAPGGLLSIWVYGPGYWGRGIQRMTGKAIHACMQRIGPTAAHSLVEHWLLPLGRLQGRLARRRWTKLLGAPAFALSVPRHPVPEVMVATIFDYFGAPIISTHGEDEVRDWIARCGFDVRSLPVPTSVQGVRRTS